MIGRDPIVQERVLPATPEAVFEAWSDPRSLARWFCPGDLRGVSVELDFRVGGRFRIVMHGEKDYVHTGEYLVIEPNRRLSFTWVSEFMPEAIARTRVVVTFEPSGERETLLRLSHEDLPDDDAYASHARGWASIIDKLEAHLASASRATH